MILFTLTRFTAGDYNALYGGVSKGKLHRLRVINSAAQYAIRPAVGEAVAKIVSDKNQQCNSRQ